MAKGNSLLVELRKQTWDLQQGVNVGLLGPKAQLQLRSLLTMSATARDHVMQNHLRKSLGFKEMFERWETVEQAHAETFQWLLEDSVTSKMTPPQLDARMRYAQWLTSGNGIFHVAGKPGSGKSTLMKFLFSHSRTKAALQRWAGTSRMIREVNGHANVS